jgi:alpha-tubulin suppressor-like RCC1 family protein
MFQGSIVKPGFNPLAAQNPTILYNLFAWGANGQGQLGLGSIVNKSSPNQIGSLTTWSNFASGFSFTAAVKTDGTLWSWGTNAQGQLGLGNTTYYSSPKQVGALTTWSKVFVGPYNYNCYGIKTDGTLWAWGYGIGYSLGQIINRTSYSSPVQVGALTNWSSGAAGSGGSVLAIKTDGTLWGWGYNQKGQIGITSATNYVSSPTQIGSLTNWLSVAATGYFTTATKTDGTLWSWGYNSNGQLGLGNTTDYSSPKQVGALTTWKQTKNGFTFVLALKTDGTMWSWGSNVAGQLGLGNFTYYSSPKQIGSLATWAKIGAGSIISAAVKTDGTLWTWGYNDSGALGLGTAGGYISLPQQVGASTTWSTVVGGYQFMVALG